VYLRSVDCDTTRWVSRPRDEIITFITQRLKRNNKLLIPQEGSLTLTIVTCECVSKLTAGRASLKSTPELLIHEYGAAITVAGSGKHVFGMRASYR
jgi:hypothetical protein